MFDKFSTGLYSRKKNLYSRKKRLTTDSMFSKLRYKFSKFLSKNLFSLAQKIDPYDSGFKTGDSSLGNKKIK